MFNPLTNQVFQVGSVVTVAQETSKKIGAKLQQKAEKNGSKLIPDCSMSKLLSKSKKHHSSAWEIWVHQQLMQNSVGSPDVSLAHIVRKEEGETPMIFGKAHTAVSMLKEPLFARLCFPGERTWLVKPCGNILGISVYIDDVMGAPWLHMVTFFKGFIAVCGSYGNNNHLNTEESKQFKGTATGNWTHYHRGTCWHCRCSLEEDRSQYWHRWINCGKRTIAPSPHPSSQSSYLLLQ